MQMLHTASTDIQTTQLAAMNPMNLLLKSSATIAEERTTMQRTAHSALLAENTCRSFERTKSAC